MFTAQLRWIFSLVAGIGVLLLAACMPAEATTERVNPLPESSIPTDKGADLPAATAREPEVADTSQTTVPGQPTSASPDSEPATRQEPAPTAVPCNTESTAPSVTPLVVTPPESEPVAVTTPPGLPPSIIAHTPSDSAGVVWTQNIRILFSRPMDPTTTEQAITVTPGGRDFSVSWHRDGTLLQLVPNAEWNAFERYEVKISAVATATDGVPLGEDFSFSFWGEEP